MRLLMTPENLTSATETLRRRGLLYCWCAARCWWCCSARAPTLFGAPFAQRAARRSRRLLKELEIARFLPVGDVAAVAPPLLALEREPGREHLLAHHLPRQRIGLERVQRLLERARQQAHPELGERLVRLEIHVVPMGLAGVEALLDALETGRQHHRDAEIGIAGAVGDAQLHATASQRNPQGIGPVVPAVADEHRRPGETGCAAADDQ